MEIEQGRVTANGLEFGYLATGKGPLALCLHGFPDSAWTWRYLLPELAAAGFRAVAPFMRGYAPTSVPSDGRYQTGALATDALALHDVLGGDGDAVIVGHDWGAAATYGAAAHEPGRWRRVVTMAVPPAGALAGAFFSYPQFKRSFYMFLFQLPMAESLVAANDLAFIEGLWSDWTGPAYDATADVAHVKDCLREPANLTAALGYYRSMLGTLPPAPELSDVQAATAAPTPQPTLYVQGADDRALGIELAKGAEAFLGPGSRMEVVEDANHFLHLEKPTEINKLVVDFVTS